MTASQPGGEIDISSAVQSLPSRPPIPTASQAMSRGEIDSIFFNLKPHQTDVKPAFLHTSINDMVYVEHDERTGCVCLLNKALYGPICQGKRSADFHAGDVSDNAAAKAKEERQDKQDSACGTMLQVCGPAASQPLQDLTVDEICESRAFDGNVKYLVKWEGYPAQRHWTWEPFEHFLGDGAKLLLKKFAIDNSDKPSDDRVHT
ncbi:hypothetical protein E4U14_006435 [Claviceps sp. LM454 group G7]|nr:hypothetical protein E4U14_006435 [Claviceps sp. LM454 group G7]